MDAIKIENFHRANPDAVFPQFAPVSDDECLNLRAAIADQIGLKRESEPIQVLNALWARATVLRDINASHGLPFHKLVPDAEADSRVFVNWYRFNDVDQFVTIDLETYFNDLWYPASDDIEDFNRTLRWFLLVRHDGQVGRLLL
jgi:hypothetical protein